jgi:pimeloyl-ACP methyl ester carboxylesterase
VWTDAEWGSLRVPALFLVGEHEAIYSAEKAVRRLKRVAPQVTAEIIPGAGRDLTVAQAAMVNSENPCIPQTGACRVEDVWSVRLLKGRAR